MKIGINGYETVIPRFGYNSKTGLPNRAGSSEYVFELLKGIYKFSKNDFFIYLPCPPSPDLPKETSNWKYRVVLKKSIWTLIDLSWEFLTKKPDLDVFLSPTHYLPAYCPYPSVISVMDLSYLHFPQLFKTKDLWQLRLWTKFSVAKAKKVITISCASKNDIIKEYGVSPDKVVVTYPGIKIKNQISKIKNTMHFSTENLLKASNSKILKKYGIDKPYILFVGTIQPRKNITRLVEAFSLLCHSERSPDVRRDEVEESSEALPSVARSLAASDAARDDRLSLVIVGRPGWMYEEIYQSPSKYGVKDQVKFLDNVTEEDLPVFYQNALVFVLPSLYEGFGLPILEAMQHGCPVITSNISSMPEAGGDAALYVDPNSVTDIADKIKKVLSDDKLREEMVKKGYEQVKKFSWEKTARETLKVLEEVVKKK